jgi:hypothetical protein
MKNSRNVAFFASGLRLSRITWRVHEPSISRERYDLMRWLEGHGAKVSAWMLGWSVTW